MLREAVRALRSEARRTNERRLLVLAGNRTAGHRAAEAAIEAADIERGAVAAVGTGGGTHFPSIPVADAATLMGTTHPAVVLDCHEVCRPNALGRVVGTVDGGGLLVLVVPDLDTWPERRDGFDATLAAPPAAIEEVTGHFRTRLVRTLREHRGIAIVDVADEVLERDGLTHPAPKHPEPTFDLPPNPEFPPAAYQACLTRDQIEAVRTFEELRQPPAAVVLEADRGRGKSSAAGLAAGSFAADGDDVLVTAPEYRNAAELFDRARELCETLGVVETGADEDSGSEITTVVGGRIRFEPPAAAKDHPGDPDVVLVDEAASLPVRILEAFLEAPRVGFATTVHGYEGAGRGFDVRFRERLESSEHAVNEFHLETPIRYAPGDPVEVWAFRALLLDARPAVDPLVEDARLEDASYRTVEAADLLDDEHLLREAFGLLVTAHYRTEPNDLARMLDAPNLSVRALLVDGHVASVALLAREGDLDADLRSAVYEGERIRGNMIPDVLMSQLREEPAGAPVGVRVMRIATHAAIRDRGFGSRLLEEIRSEFAGDVDWIGTGFGATPELVRFWAENGYTSVHLATTRNERSGEYSVLMLDPVSETGEALCERHAAWFADRVGSQLGDVLRDVDPDVVRAVLRAGPDAPAPMLSEREWRLVVGAACGPALYSVDPGPFEDLAVWQLLAGDPVALDRRQERLLVAKVLQKHSWDSVAERLGYPGTSAAMRALGDAYRPVVDARAPPEILDDCERYRDT
ncbi:MAG: tRNA(Met) cytidine acetyltransferase TmcA [Halanaeroarchaeum sp.]